MTVAAHLFALYALPDTGERWLVRALRPAAPMDAAAPLRAARTVYEAKRDAILASAWRAAGHVAGPGDAVQRVGEVAYDPGAPPFDALASFRGVPALDIGVRGEGDTLELLTPGAAEDAPTMRVRLVTEGDFLLEGEPAFLAQDVMWVDETTEARIVAGLPDARGPRPPAGDRGEREWHRAVLAVHRAHLAHLEAEEDALGVAFELVDLARNPEADAIFWETTRVVVRRYYQGVFDDALDDLSWALACAIEASPERDDVAAQFVAEVHDRVLTDAVIAKLPGLRASGV